MTQRAVPGNGRCGPLLLLEVGEHAVDGGDRVAEQDARQDRHPVAHRLGLVDPDGGRLAARHPVQHEEAVQRPGDLRDLLQAMRRLDEGRAGACGECFVGAGDRLVEADDGARVAPGDHDEGR